MMASRANDGTDHLGRQLAVELRLLLDDKPVGSHFDVSPSADICSSLELFIPRSLRDVYPEWARESLDGIFVARATKVGPTNAEFVGTCILISDQTVTPFAVQLETIEEAERVVVVRLKLGEPGTGPLGISGPPVNSKDARALLASLLERIDDVDWSYVLPPT